MKRTLFIMSMVSILLSCNEPEISHPYYQFTAEDYKYIPTVYDEVGDITKFRNQLGEEVQLEVLNYSISKETHPGLITGSDEPYHNYQKLKIELKVVDEDSVSSNCDLKKIEVTNWAGYYLLTRFSFSGGPNPCTDGANSQRLEFPYNTRSMDINTITYTKVVTLFDGLNTFFDSNYFFDKVYFDFKEGIIGFDDTQNDVQFRIVNNQ